ncbi:E3 ubiquitin-protein ligase TRIM35-like isoform X2 [Conger conger]|uniref:E3 ubiquitin-protein ligase TRIM35-like isoform X2 n=1 Tax=Conger conger TaxID=82655 RepID=UPI002A5A4D1E|nr:E3 ubiquitin-protein ligase TRIM35-like isoform X2 [Conger conger]
MASISSLPVEDLTCPVCIDIFEDPVILKCSHSFCKTCLEKCFEPRGTGSCPVCKWSSTEFPLPNLALRNLCESMLKNRIKKPASASESLCGLHGEKLKLFCLSDEEPICFICQTSEKHDNHKLRPLKEAALKYKVEVEKALRHLQEKLEAFIKEKQKSERDAKLIKSDTECTILLIQEEFEMLHKFLRDEEVARIAALREEEEQKSQSIKERVEKMTKGFSSLSATIKALEQDMKADDNSFLQNYKAIKRRAQYKVSNLEKVSGERINVATHLGNLKFSVWEKMKGIVKFNIEPETKESSTPQRKLSGPIPEGANTSGKMSQVQRSSSSAARHKRLIKRIQIRPRQKVDKKDCDELDIRARALYDYQAAGGRATTQTGAVECSWPITWHASKANPIHSEPG